MGWGIGPAARDAQGSEITTEELVHLPRPTGVGRQESGDCMGRDPRCQDDEEVGNPGPRERMGDGEGQCGVAVDGESRVMKA